MPPISPTDAMLIMASVVIPQDFRRSAGLRGRQQPTSVFPSYFPLYEQRAPIKTPIALSMYGTNDETELRRNRAD